MTKTRPPPPNSDLLRQELNALEDAVSADEDSVEHVAARPTKPQPSRHKSPSAPTLPRKRNLQPGN